MKKLTDRIFGRYDDRDWLEERKARTLLLLNFFGILVFLIDGVISSLLLGRLAPEVITNTLVVAGFVVASLLVIRGFYDSAATLGIVLFYFGITLTRFSITGQYSTDPSYDFLQYTLDIILIFFYSHLISNRTSIVAGALAGSIVLLALYGYLLPSYFHANISRTTLSIIASGFIYVIIAGLFGIVSFLQNKKAVAVASLESAASRESEQRYREIFNSTAEAIFVHDSLTGQIIDVNDVMLNMYGCESKEKALASTIGDFSEDLRPLPCRRL